MIDVYEYITEGRYDGYKFVFADDLDFNYYGNFEMSVDRDEEKEQ